MQVEAVVFVEKGWKETSCANISENLSFTMTQMSFLLLYLNLILHYNQMHHEIFHTCYSIVTVECISSYKLVNTKHDNEPDPT